VLVRVDPFDDAALQAWHAAYLEAETDGRPFAVPWMLAEVRAAAVAAEEADLDGRGRILLRPSGTEPLVRVMVEAPDEAECEAVLGRLVDAAKAALG